MAHWVWYSDISGQHWDALGQLHLDSRRHRGFSSYARVALQASLIGLQMYEVGRGGEARCSFRFRLPRRPGTAHLSANYFQRASSTFSDIKTNSSNIMDQVTDKLSGKSFLCICCCSKIDMVGVDLSVNDAHEESATTSSDRGEPGPKLLRLSDLPGEIKNRIYRYAVVSSSPIILRTMEPKKKYDTSKQPIGIQVIGRLINGSPSLGQVSRQLRTEINGIYYEENVFMFTEIALRPSIVRTFQGMAGGAANKVQNIKVIHTLRNCASHGDQPDFDIKFTAIARNASLEIDFAQWPIESRSKYGYGQKARAKLCCCTLASLRAKHEANAAMTATGSSALFDFLCDYAKLFVGWMDFKSKSTVQKECRECRGLKVLYPRQDRPVGRFME